MATKMPGRLVALSASAVATIYLAGLLSTQSGTDSSASAAQSAATATSSPTPAIATPAQTSANPSSAPTVVVGASATAIPATATATSTQTTSTSTYANGTYSATGTSQLGNVTVSVTVAGDKITNVQITRVTTKFPVSRIASLPAQVIQSQSSSVNVVSGATYSSQAFKQAVQAALAQARAANSSATAG